MPGLFSMPRLMILPWRLCADSLIVTAISLAISRLAALGAFERENALCSEGKLRLFSREMSQKVQALQMEKRGLQVCHVDSLDEMLLGHAKHYPYECNYTEVRWDLVLVLLSSGSTGITYISDKNRREKLMIGF